MQKDNFTDIGVGCIHYGEIYTRYGMTTTSTISHVSKELEAKFKKAQNGDIIFVTTSKNLNDVCKCVAWLEVQT